MSRQKKGDWPGLFWLWHDAAFWGRPPEDVHRDLLEQQRRKVMPQLTPDLVAAVKAGELEISKLQNQLAKAEDLISGLSDDLRGIAKLLPMSLVPAFLELSEQQRAEVADMMVSDRLSKLGPEALADPAIGKYLQVRWLQMRNGESSGSRKMAKRRFEKIVRSFVPDQRRHREGRQLEVTELAREVGEVEQSIRAIRKHRWRSLPALQITLREKYPQWPARLTDALAAALCSRDRDRHAVRKALYRIVGLRFNMGAGTLPALVATGRRRMKREHEIEVLQLRATDGRDRYMAWCRQKGFSPLIPSR